MKDRHGNHTRGGIAYTVHVGASGSDHSFRVCWVCSAGRPSFRNACAHTLDGIACTVHGVVSGSDHSGHVCRVYSAGRLYVRSA